MKYICYIFFSILIGTPSYLHSSDRSFPWSHILLVINYNFVHYESVSLLKKIYSSYFKHMVFYGPIETQEVHGYNQNRGYLSYGALADAMERYPQFAGYLFVMDDCIIHPWFFNRFNFKKVWWAGLEFGNNFKKPKYINEPILWNWWKTEWGLPALLKVYPLLLKYGETQLVKNCGKDGVVIGYADIAYIPSLYRSKFIELAKICVKHSLFLEIALPTILSCLAPIESFEEFVGNSTYVDDPSSVYDIDADFNHPMKLSNHETFNFINTFFEVSLKI